MTTHDLLTRIKVKIRESGTSNIKIGAIANITKNRINAIFAGNTPMHVKELIAISAALSVHPSVWFVDVNEQFDNMVNEPGASYVNESLHQIKEMNKVYKQLIDGYKDQIELKNDELDLLRSRIVYMTNQIDALKNKE